MRRLAAAAAGATVRVRQTWSDGWNSLTLRGDQPATVDSIEINADKGLKQVGALLAVRGETGIQFDESFPPTAKEITSPLFQAAGAIIRPHKTYEIFIGMQATRPGYFVRKNFVVSYHIGDERFSRVFDVSLGMCTSKQYWRKDSTGYRDCPMPPAWR
jgi:hypothetical protein